MRSIHNQSRRTVSLIAAHVACAVPLAAVSPVHGQIRDWDTGFGDWSDPGNWSPLGLPLSTEIARIGAHAAAQNSFVDLDMNDTVAGLIINDGMVLSTNGYALTVNGDTVVSDRNEPPGIVVYPSRLHLTNGAAATDFRTDDLTITNGAHVRSEGSPTVQIDATLSTNTGTWYQGNGTMNFVGDTGPVIVNNGRIEASAGTLTLNQLGDARFDLDGVLGQGRLWLGAVAPNTLSVHGTSLTDDFSGVILLAGGSSLHMHLTEGWVADASSTIDIAGGGPDAPGASVLGGSGVTLGGALSVWGVEGRLNVDADSATILPSATLAVGADDGLSFMNETTIEGGAFVVEPGGQLTFYGPVRLEGGDFDVQPVDAFSFGAMLFDAVEFAGNVGSAGLIEFFGEVDVLATSVLNAESVNMDGYGTTPWHVNAPMTINADRIDTEIIQRFDDQISFGSGFTASLTINLTNGGWILGGALDITGSNLGYISRLNGSPVEIQGNLSLAANKAQINADTDIGHGAVVTLAASSASLRMNGATTVRPGAAFQGDGSLRVGAAGTTTLESTASLGSVGLVNEGVLKIADGAGSASVDRFENTATGTLRVELGGPAPGAGHDLLIVTGGPAVLAGTLEVSLLGEGAAQYQPQVGDTFTVLTAQGGIAGAFDSVPDTIAGGDRYQWAASADAAGVTIELVGFEDNIAPCGLADIAQPWGVLDLADVTAFIGAFTSQDPSADIGAPYGVWGLEDVIAFIVSFQAGCP